MYSEAEEIKEKWAWIFKSVRSAWRKVSEWNAAIHQKLHSKYPRLTRFLGQSLRLIFDVSTHPSFAVVVAFLLVGLVISEAITIIVSVSALAAWIVTILWIAHSKPLNNVSIVPKIVIVLTCGCALAYIANRYTQWCLTRYALKHSSELATAAPSQPAATEQKQPSDNQLLLDALNKALKQSIPTRQSPPTGPVIAPTSNSARVVFGFYSSDFNGNPQTLQFDGMLNNTATFDVSFMVVGNVAAQNLQIWARACGDCEWVDSPPEFVESNPDHPYDRYFASQVPWVPNVQSPKTTFRVRFPIHNPQFAGTELALYYACSNCPPVDWAKPQKLTMSRTLGTMTTQMFPPISRSPALPADPSK